MQKRGFSLNNLPQDLSHLLLHAASAAARPTLQGLLDSRLEVAPPLRGFALHHLEYTSSF
jgi:hypothetical protein